MLAGKFSDRFQEMGVTYTMKIIHAEAKTGQHLPLNLEFVYGDDAGYILLGCAQPNFVAAHKTVCSAIHQDHCIQGQLLYEGAVAC